MLFKISLSTTLGHVHFKAESCFTGDISCHKPKFLSGLKKKRFEVQWNGGFQFLICGRCGVIAMQILKSIWRQLADNTNLLFAKLLMFLKVEGKKDWKPLFYSRGHVLSIIELYTIYYTKHICFRTWYKHVVRHKWTPHFSLKFTFSVWKQTFTDQLVEIRH